MENLKNSLQYFGIIILLLLSCADSKVDEKQSLEEQSKLPIKDGNITVRITPARKASFPIRKITTGYLCAAKQAEISMKISGNIKELSLQNGQFIERGGLMVKLDDTQLRFQLEDYHFAFEDALLKKNDLLIANGGTAGVDSSVTSQKLKLIIIESGFARAKYNIRKGEYELSQATLNAPFNGIVADLEARQYEQINAGQKICRLLDPSTFQVVFHLLEGEALQVRKGQKVKIFPSSIKDLELSAAIQTINPVVDENGLVEIRASLNTYQGFRPLEGLKVRLYLEKQIPDQVIIPKSALVLRSGRHVVFVYDTKEKLAKWHYVVVANENNEDLAIGEGLEEGDLVIYDGNLNLAHDAKVVVAEENVNKN